MEGRQIKVNLTGLTAPSGSAVEYMEWLKAKIESIPEEFRESAIYEVIEDPANYDPNWVYKTFYYFRPQTKDEAEVEMYHAMRQRKETESKERMMLRQLQHKYGKE